MPFCLVSWTQGKPDQGFEEKSDAANGLDHVNRSYEEDINVHSPIASPVASSSHVDWMQYSPPKTGLSWARKSIVSATALPEKRESQHEPN